MAELEQQELTEDQAMVQGFNNAHGEVSDQVPQYVEPAEDFQESDEAPSQPEVQEEKPVLAGYTESQIKQMFDRAAKVDELERQLRTTNDRLNGTAGNMKQTIDQLKTEIASAMAMGKTHSEAVNWLKNELPDFGEHIGKITERQALEAADAQRQAEARAATEASVVTTIDARLQNVTQAKDAELYALKVELLDSMHPDRVDIVAKDDAGRYVNRDFNDWLVAMSLPEKEEFLSSMSPGYVSRKLTDFKTWRDTKHGKKSLLASAAAAPSARRSERQTNYEDEDAAMREGFKRIHG